MGKKTKKTRWRALTLINGHHSDSEDSNSKPLVLIHTSASSRNYYQNHQGNHYRSYSSKFHYGSSLSTPIKKYQNDSSSKTTRSNSTTSDHQKTTTTFNEDEYTRITTPRQDVLFKKGYLNKPKSYQTQTSTGTSSTANSTSTCTPDHQSADGTEGTDLEYESQFVFPNGFIDHNGIYYINSFEPFPLVVYNAPVCFPSSSDYTRTKRYSTDSVTESVSPQNEEVNQNGFVQPSNEFYCNVTSFDGATVIGEHVNDVNDVHRRHGEDEEEEDHLPKKPKQRKKRRKKEQQEERVSSSSSSSDEVFEGQEPGADETNAKPNDAQNLLLQSLLKGFDQDQKIVISTKEDEPDSQKSKQEEKEKIQEESKYSLKPDAEEFVPRTLRPTLSYDPNLQFINFAPPNFIPIHPHQFLPPGIPINFIPSHDPKMVPNFVSVLPASRQEQIQEVSPKDVQPRPLTPPLQPPAPSKPTEIDIAKIVSKLEEEAAKQQRNHGNYHNRVYQNQRGRHPNPHYNRARINATTGSVEKASQEQKRNLRRQMSNPEPKKTEAQTLTKKSEAKYPRYERQIKRPTPSPKSSPAKPSPSSHNKPLTNQWISVSNRKKRKNKTIDEQEQEVHEENETEELKNDDEFESFDVNMLVDVVPTSQVVEETEAATMETVETVQELSDMEHLQKIVSPNETKPEMATEMLWSLPTAASPTVKKKSKKGTQKPLTKRIMITDRLETEQQASEMHATPPPSNTTTIPLDTATPPTEPTSSLVNATPLSMTTDQLPIVTQATPPIITPSTTSTNNFTTTSSSSVIATPTSPSTAVSYTPSDSETMASDIPEKKSSKKTKKKKARPSVPTAPPLVKIQSVSSSNTTLSNLDDSYDFLLENSIVEGFDLKTNVEISRELDLIIQKGMYNSLEEKIKALNIGVSNDGFFRTFDYFRYQPNMTDTRGSNFGSLPKNDNMYVRASTSSGLFLDEETTECQNLTAKGEDNQHETSLTSTTTYKKTFSVTVGSIHDDSEVRGGQRPITQAVKEWMARTRENTPDIEILKSPNTIYKEFSDVTKTQTDTKINEEPINNSSNDNDQEEVTIWSLEEEELLDCWENEGRAPAHYKIAPTFATTNGNCHDSNVYIEEGEEAIEIYESKYGKNEDYLRIRAEIEEAKDKKIGFPKHANLPYRAICCSIM